MALVGILVACENSEPTLAPDNSPNSHTVQPLALQTAATNTHFRFLPPLAAATGASGASDPDAAVVVDICALQANTAESACREVIQGFTRTSPNGATQIRYEATSEQYIVNWQTDQCLTGACTLPPDSRYRISVRIGAIVLGTIDVVLQAGGKEAKSSAATDAIALVNGRTLPVKFRVERDAVRQVASGSSVVIGSAGGAVLGSNGKVGLQFPAGALSGNTAITVTEPPATIPAMGAWSTPVELGPDGTTFATPVKLTLGYDATKLPPGITPSDLTIYTWESGGWLEVPGSTTDPTANTVVASLSHFSIYIVGVRASVDTTPSHIGIVKTGSTFDVVARVVKLVPTQLNTCYQVRNQLSWHTVCTTVQSAYEMPIAGAIVFWTLLDPRMFVASPGSTSVTDANGSARSPLYRPTFPGIWGVRVSLSQTSWIHRSVQALDPVDIVPDTLHTVPGWRLGLDVRRSSPLPYDVPIALENKNASVLITDITTGTTSGGGRTSSHIFPASALVRPFAVHGSTSPVLDTIIVSAPNYYFPDTAIVSLVPGRLVAHGVPQSLVEGDSAEIFLTFAHPFGHSGILAAPISLGLNSPGAGIAFADSAGPISGITAQGDRSRRFWIKAAQPGSQSFTVTEANYAPLVVSLSVTPKPRTQLYTSRPSWTSSVGGMLDTIMFDQLDDGLPITRPATDLHFATLTLRGTTFQNVRSYWNISVYNFPNVPMRAVLPPGTTYFGFDLGPFYNAEGDYTVRLSTGEVFTRHTLGLPGGVDFFGFKANEPIEWVEVSLNALTLVMDNFTIKGTSRPRTFDNLNTWLASNSSPVTTVDFTTKDDGSLITDPPTHIGVSSMVLRGVEFTNWATYWNQSATQGPNNFIRARLPANVTSVGFDMGPFYDAAGLFTIRLSSGEVYRREARRIPWTPDFFGIQTPRPLEWIEISYDATSLVIDNFRFHRP